jgi:hypothetical protein
MIARIFSCLNGAAWDDITPLHRLHIAFLRDVRPFLRLIFTLSPCGEGSVRSLQDNSKIRGYLLLLMSGGRAGNQFDLSFRGQSNAALPGTFDFPETGYCAYEINENCRQW